nr:mechanosensitive ion channel family protein [Prevotella sp.]
MTKKALLTIILLITVVMQGHAVLKEKDLNSTLLILRQELIDKHDELEKRNKFSQMRDERIMKQFREIFHRSNQNSLMLYSQKPDYVFDMTYACHEATNQYQEFSRGSAPLRKFMDKNDAEIARYDSLIGSLEKMMRFTEMNDKARIDCNVCLTLATNIRKAMMENRQAMNDYERLYKFTEQRLKNLNDYANKRYDEIQNSIFKNGGENYFSILASLQQNVMATAETVSDKYRPLNKIQSQWDSKIILDLFLSIFVFAIVSILLNLLVFRWLMPQKFRTESFRKKRACIIMTTTTLTFAAIIAILRASSNQNFLIMASDLLVEYAWLLSVILISLLLRVEGDQIKSAFRIYSPLIVMGFLVIAFRIVLIPNDLVNLILPPILLACTLWQWSVIRRHGKQIPRSDIFYSYISLVIFIASTICSWVGYTLLSVQLLIWWIMQLTCILTITCLTVWMKKYSDRHHIYERPVTETWFFRFVYRVVLPVLGLFSIPLSIYMAADVFNLSDLTWSIFTKPFIDQNNLRISIFSIIQVVELYFLFGYLNRISLDFLRLHYQRKNLHDKGTREVMGKNVIQVLIWGIWLIICLGIFHVGGTWLGYIAGGLSTGIGFASKDILENFYYGINLMAGRVKVGDWIECDGIKGKVSSISYTSTLIEAIDGSVIAFTNS